MVGSQPDPTHLPCPVTGWAVDVGERPCPACGQDHPDIVAKERAEQAASVDAMDLQFRMDGHSPVLQQAAAGFGHDAGIMVCATCKYRRWLSSGYRSRRCEPEPRSGVRRQQHRIDLAVAALIAVPLAVVAISMVVRGGSDLQASFEAGDATMVGLVIALPMLALFVMFYLQLRKKRILHGVGVPMNGRVIDVRQGWGNEYASGKPYSIIEYCTPDGITRTCKAQGTHPTDVALLIDPDNPHRATAATRVEVTLLEWVMLATTFAAYLTASLASVLFGG